MSRAAGGDSRLAPRRPAAEQDSQAAGPEGRRDSVSDAASLRRPRAALWPHGPDDPRRRRRAGPGAASRYRLGRVGHARSGTSGFRAWIFTAVRSRYRFVYPTFEETTARAIEACEAAWAFFGGDLRGPDSGQHESDHHDGRPARIRGSRRPFSSTRKRAASTSMRRACGIRKTKGASSAPSRPCATTASPARS